MYRCSSNNILISAYQSWELCQSRPPSPLLVLVVKLSKSPQMVWSSRLWKLFWRHGPAKLTFR